jgi:AcrR family transcriptional regulator
MGTAASLGLITENAQKPRSGLGRPRNHALDEQILQAVRDILAERGYGRLTIQEVTRRCGIHVRTVTRRWETKGELVAAAILGTGQSVLAPDLGTDLWSGDPRRDFRRLIVSTVMYVADPTTRTAITEITNEAQTNERVRRLLNARLTEWSESVQFVLECAVDSGTLPRSALRQSQYLPNILAGIALGIGLMDMTSPDPQTIDRVTDFVLAALTAAD